MCGISLIISGVRIDLSSLLPDTTICSSLSGETANFLFSVDDIKAALRRRGPDSLGSKSIFLHADEERTLQSSVEEEKAIEGSHFIEIPVSNNTSFGKLIFVGATLQLRGVYPITQPLVDKSGNILIYNGEVFGGIELNSDTNDTEVLMQSLKECCNCLSHEHEGTCGNGKYSVPELLSKIKGPWALIYWQVTFAWKTQRQYGLVEMHLEGEVFLFIGLV
ncbi:unnamed protein product [Lactuca virosa]|uniref:Glutamine amidotransferase type-2 domain-containing protein n=1 Tax=Lactuca virosa TaxID=75947 RepID=A0AAU9LRU0_9ASTR|nr:unnamed protein product [Lactuca virosa]